MHYYKRRGESLFGGSLTGESSAAIIKRGGRSPQDSPAHVCVRARAPSCAVRISKDRPRVSRSANLSCRLMEAGPAD